jgi:hypothetical protein
MKRHAHRAIPSRSRTVGYTHPVRFPENRAAHGNVCHHDVCRCGATRRTNVNGLHVERGPWSEPARCDETAHYQSEG